MIKKTLLILTVVLLGACSSREVLLRDISERDANEIIAVLYSNSVDAQKSADAKGKSFSVLVAGADLAKSVALLRAVGLPRENHPSLNEVFKSSGFAPTPFEERVRFIYGTSQELERTISYMQGVLTARVHVVIPEKSRRKENQSPASASVYINYDEKVPFELQVPNIRKLVTESIEGLDEEHVQILITAEHVDLSKIAGTPVTSFLGIRVYQEDYNVFVAVFGVFLMILVGSLYAARRPIIAFAKRLR